MSRVAFLFPGQGAQHVGMGQRLQAEYPAARELFARAESILGFDLAVLCSEGPSERLNSTVISQPALFVCSLAALEMLRVEQPEMIEQCGMTAGLSLGEYTALVFADALSFEDGLRVVQQRGVAMQAAADATTSGMASILMLEEPQVNEICAEASTHGAVSIANYLCPLNLVISGEKAGLEKAVELAETAGGRVVPLAVAGAFHTALMKPADERLREALADVDLRPPRIPVISNVDFASHDDPEEIRELLVSQVISPVRWEDSMRVLIDSDVGKFFEIGPGKVLRGLLKRINRKLPCESVNDS